MNGELSRLRLLSDADLLSGLNGLMGVSRRTVAHVVAHIGEVEQRRLHLLGGYGSMFAYCVSRLGMSEDEAWRRIEVARLVRRFPGLFDRLAAGHVSLSVAALLRRHLNEANHETLLDAVSGKTLQRAREILAAWFPQPDILPSIRKLHTRHVRDPQLPSAQLHSTRLPDAQVLGMQVAGARASGMRSPGMRVAGAQASGAQASGTQAADDPVSDAQTSAARRSGSEGDVAASASARGAQVELAVTPTIGATNGTEAAVEREACNVGGMAAKAAAACPEAGAVGPQCPDASDRALAAPAHSTARGPASDGSSSRVDHIAPHIPAPPSPASRRRARSLEPLAPGRYKVQFAASAELARKLELARDLLRHAIPSGDLAMIIERALDLLLQRTAKRRFGATAGGRCAQPANSPPDAAHGVSALEVGAAEMSAAKAPAVELSAAETSVVKGTAVEVAAIEASTAKSSTVEIVAVLSTLELDAAAPSARDALGDAIAAVPAPVALAGPVSSPPAPPTRHIPSHVRRAVLIRDEARCTWEGPDGVRCNSRAWLEHDHVMPRGKGGGNSPSNIRLLCRAHNRLAAELSYGRDAMARIIARRRARRCTPSDVERKSSENDRAPGNLCSS